MEIYTMGPSNVLAVADASVGFATEDLKPTTGRFQGMEVAIAEIYAVGALYKEYNGVAATTNGIPMAAGDSFVVEGYENIKGLRFIRNTSTTSIIWAPGYR